MKDRVLPVLTTLMLAAGAVAVLFLWLTRPPTLALAHRIPGADGADSAGAHPALAVDIKGRFSTGDGVPLAMPISGAWPCFRGANHDNISTETASLADSWPPGGPPILWSLDLGDGHAGPAVWNGRIFILDYDEPSRSDSLRCLSLADGREIWRRAYRTGAKRNHGISRTVPAVTDRYVVTIGPKCHVMCVDTLTGNFRWGMDLVRDHGATEPLWFTGQCPIIDRTTAIIAPAGKALLMGVDCGTGRILWQTPNPRGWKMSHSSIMPMTLNGRRTYVYCAIGGVVAVAADGDNAGQVLWETTEWNNAVVAPSPVPLDQGRLFLTAGYGRGSLMLQISEINGAWTVSTLHRLPRTVFSCEQQTPIFYQGHLFSTLTKDAGVLKNQFACLHPDGTLAWSSGNTHQFGLGPFLLADNKIFILNDEGTLTLIRADTTRYEQLAQARMLDGRDAWGPMALVGGKLLLRDAKKMLCIDVRAP